MESLTKDLAAAAWALIGEVEARGGMTKAATSGLPKRMIEEAATRRRGVALDKGEEVIVGVNKYRLENEPEKSKRARSTMPQCEGRRSSAWREPGVGGTGLRGASDARCARPEREERRRQSIGRRSRGGASAGDGWRDFRRLAQRIREPRGCAGASAAACTPRPMRTSRNLRLS